MPIKDDMKHQPNFMDCLSPDFPVGAKDAQGVDAAAMNARERQCPRHPGTGYFMGPYDPMDLAASQRDWDAIRKYEHRLERGGATFTPKETLG